MLKREWEFLHMQRKWAIFRRSSSYISLPNWDNTGKGHPCSEDESGYSNAVGFVPWAIGIRVESLRLLYELALRAVVYTT